ncbi:MAG TPA: SGNH/GDSL hydrolase family protein [Planctomycetota bacterium]|nr:SGNH/GDSL hydrolase family protein [Planctomycetota bacterium]
MKLLLPVLLCLLPQGVPADPLPVSVGPRDPAIRLIGRFDDRDPAGPRMAWAGSTVAVKFTGSALNVQLRSSGADQFQVVLDGSPASVLALTKDATVYPVASGLPAKEHTAELFKRTEPLVGQTQLLGFQLEKGGKLLPNPSKIDRRIEVVGDSITCGYGNEAPKETEKFSAATENNYQAYGAMSARDLKADYVAIAWSGKWLFGPNAIPLLYDRALPNDADSKWDFKGWIPQVVVVNLGTNDFGPRNPTEQEWQDAYRAFIKVLRGNYPQCHVFCAVGSMMSDGYPQGRKALSTIRQYTTGLVEALKKAGDKKIHYVEFDPQDMKNGIGADWHPSVKTHRLMADRLTAAIKKELGW